MIEIQIKRSNKKWKTIKTKDTPILQSKLCDNPNCNKYVGIKHRNSKHPNTFCSLECARNSRKIVIKKAERDKLPR